MSQGRTTGSDRDAALRRVAIVLSSLPAPVASQLLGTMDRDSKQMLRRTMSSLSDVDPLERKRALQAFKGSLEHSPSHAANKPDATRPAAGFEDEISIPRDAQQRRQPGSRVVNSTVSSEPYQPPVQPSTSLAFLDDVDDDTLVGLLGGEHPQAIALVLASIAPAQAARVLPSLDPKMQSDALSRIGRLGEIPEDVVNEIASHLRSRIQQQESNDRNESGKKALSAILAAMPQQPAIERYGNRPTTTAPVHSNPVHSNPVHSNPDHSSDHSDPFDSPVPSQPAAVEHVGFDSADLSAVDQTHRLRLVAGYSPTEMEVFQPGEDLASESVSDLPEQPTGDDTPDRGTQSPSILVSTDAIHEYLIGLTPDELCLALGQVSTRQAMLTLCGLPNDIAEAVMAILPRAQAKQVRRSMSSLQSLELREIDEAKEAVAKVSMDDRSPDESEISAATDQAARMAA